MTDSIILAAAGVRVIDDDYEPVMLPGRWAVCYDARTHSYRRCYVQPLGLQPVQARRGDEAMDFEPPPLDDMPNGIWQAHAAKKRIVAEKRQQVLEVMRQAGKPLRYNDLARISGMTHKWLRVHLPLMDEVVAIKRGGRGGTLWGLKGVEYNLPDWVRKGTQ